MVARQSDQLKMNHARIADYTRTAVAKKPSLGGLVFENSSFPSGAYEVFDAKYTKKKSKSRCGSSKAKAARWTQIGTVCALIYLNLNPSLTLKWIRTCSPCVCLSVLDGNLRFLLVREFIISCASLRIESGIRESEQRSANLSFRPYRLMIMSTQKATWNMKPIKWKCETMQPACFVYIFTCAEKFTGPLFWKLSMPCGSFWLLECPLPSVSSSKGFACHFVKWYSAQNRSSSSVRDFSVHERGSSVHQPLSRWQIWRLIHNSATRCHSSPLSLQSLSLPFYESFPLQICSVYDAMASSGLVCLKKQWFETRRWSNVGASLRVDQKQPEQPFVSVSSFVSLLINSLICYLSV